MSKHDIIKILKIFSIFMIFTAAAGTLAIGIFAQHPDIKPVMYALCTGLSIGGFIKIKYSIPYKYNDKDERDLIITLIASILSSTYFGVASFAAFTFVITKIVTINVSDTSYSIAFFLIIGGTAIVDKAAYMILQHTY